MGRVGTRRLGLDRFGGGEPRVLEGKSTAFFMFRKGPEFVSSPPGGVDGDNSIQLVWESKVVDREWTFDSERPDNPIPPEFLREGWVRDHHGGAAEEPFWP